MESVTRHRGGGQDGDRKIIPATSTALTARKVAPVRRHAGPPVTMRVCRWR